MAGKNETAHTDGRLKVLFGCSRNQWRSPTAEQIWRRHPRLLARSGGTSPSARHTVSADDVCWADVIFAMEDKYKSRLVAEFTRLLAGKPIQVLDIPDEYKYMDLNWSRCWRSPWAAFWTWRLSGPLLAENAIDPEHAVAHGARPNDCFAAVPVLRPAELVT